MVLDYSKFDTVGDDDDEFVEQLKKEVEYSRPENAMNTHYARGLLSDPLFVDIFSDMHPKDDRDDKIKLDVAGREALLAFICIQQMANGEKDNTPRGKAIVDFINAGTAPKMSVLLAMTFAMQKRIDASSRPADETQPIRDMLLGALNTLLAVAKKGSATLLFDELMKNPDGAFARRYKARAFATERFAKYAEKARHEEGAHDQAAWKQHRGLMMIDHVAPSKMF